MRITASGYGRRVGLELAPADLGAVRAVLPWWWRDDDGDAGADVDVLGRVPDAASARDVVAAVELDVAEHADGFVFVHAAVVAVDGLALLLPGRSLAGKSTLTAALLRTGAAYLSDEYAVLDPTGRVHPYPRPLTLRTPTGRRYVDVAAVAGPLHVSTVAVLRHATDAGYDVVPLTAGEAVLAVLDNTVCARSRPAEALTAVTAACAGATAVAGRRGEADEAATALLASVGARQGRAAR